VLKSWRFTYCKLPMLHAGCTVPTADGEAMERIMLWQITNLQQWGCATYLNGTSLVHRLAEQYTSLSTAGETVITNVTIETFGEASIRSLCACFPCKLCIVAYTHAHLGRLHVFACSSMGFDETGAWIRTSNPHSYTYSSHCEQKKQNCQTA